MKKNIVRKGLVIGIIALFIGIGIQPAISSEITIPKISYNEEDCDCNIPNAKLHLAEKVINKAENYLETKDLNIPDELPFVRPVCKMLESIAITYASLCAHYMELAENTTYDTPEYWYYYRLGSIYLVITFSIFIVGASIFCWEGPDWGPPPY